MTEDIVDYAMPCMMAEAQLKKSHNAALAKRYDDAIEHAMMAMVECRMLVNALKDMKEREDAIR